MKFRAVCLLLCAMLVVSGCGQVPEESEEILGDYTGVELTYFKLFDDSEVMKPVIEEFEASHPGLKINYKKFTNFEEYQDLIVKEVLEGEGPDIFSVRNDWFFKNRWAIEPVPQSLMSLEEFQSTFVDFVASDLIYRDVQGDERIYGVPMNIDSLVSMQNVNFDGGEDAIIQDFSDRGAEIDAFARGETAEILGYAFTYRQVLDRIQSLGATGESHIEPMDIALRHLTMYQGAATGNDLPLVVYFGETVSKNSEHSDLAWEFLMEVVSKENLERYFQETGNPSSRKDLMEIHSEDPVYGIFADQLGG